MMLGLQGNTSSSKVYRCVACSATFNGLASLLVHQATHATALPKVPGTTITQDTISPRETLFASTCTSSEPRSPKKLLSESTSPSFYICDCGEEFPDFGLMLEHKRSHASELVQPLDNSPQHLSFPPVSQLSLVLGYPSTSRAPAAKLPILPADKAEPSQQDEIAMVTIPQNPGATTQDEGQLDNMSTAEERIPVTAEDMLFQDKINSVQSTDRNESLPRKNALMKLVASAYMKRSQPQNENTDMIIPKPEAVSVDITPSAKTAEPQINDLSIAQLRRLLEKPGMKTKAPSISRILESSSKKVVSLTKTFSPVVLLETRQKLMDPSSNGAHGRYQCGRCRRVFQNLNKLTEHHFLHKKERIKCCRRCKQLIIGRVPLPDNHVCPQIGNKTMHSSSSLKKKQSFGQKLVPFHSLNNAKKVYFCPLCKHSYARRWNLKTHKCQGPRPALFCQANSSIQETLSLRLHSTSNSNTEKDKPELPISKSICIGTDNPTIKVEVTSQKSEHLLGPQLAWTNAAKRFSPFSAKSSVIELNLDPSLPGNSLEQKDKNSWDSKNSENDRSNEGQWIMPLDDEMEMFSSAKKNYKSEVKASVRVAHAEIAPQGLRYFVRDGVKRYPCNRCQKTYSRASTLRRHLRLCGFRLRGFGAGAQSGSQAAFAQNAGHIKPMFACFVCGKMFNRKDNMMVHRKKCQLQQSRADVELGTVPQSLATTDCQTQEDDRGNWGIMSLPSVLPRRVTCECGVGFTSPRLLLEHLQKHAQESYTCPTCGETVSSWADYEVHLQIHMHPHHQLLKGLQPQRSQPLLLRFQQQQAPQQATQSAQQPPQKQMLTEPLPNPSKKQRIVCSRCGNSFATHCSLRRHLSWNRCKGGRITNQPTGPPKTHHCSSCNCDFPNAVSLMFHQRSGACKPAIKPVRCPICLRWFGAVDSLQKHLLTHKQSDAYRCDVCNGTYPNLKSLKNHRRRIHRIMAGDTQPNAQEQLTS